MSSSVIGFALLWAVGKGCVNQNAFTYPGNGVGLSVTFAFYLLVSTIVAILGPIALRRVNPTTPAILCPLAVSTSLGLVILMTLPESMWWFFGSFLSATGLIMLEIISLRSFMGTASDPLDICIAVLVGDLFSCCFSLPIPPPLRLYLFAAFPFISAMLLNDMSNRMIPDPSINGAGGSGTFPMKEIRTTSMPLLGFTAITMISVATSYLFMSMGALSPDTQTLIHLIAPLVGVVIGTLLVRLRLYKTQLVIPAFLITALALLPAPLLGLWYLGPIKAVTLVIQEVLFLSLAHASAEATREYNLPDCLLPSVAFCSLSASTLLGALIGTACESLSSVGLSPFATIEVISLFLLLVSGILAFAAQRTRKADIQSVMEGNPSSMPRQGDSAVAMHSFGFTARETEIVSHLLLQETPQQIADKLFLSCSTVRGHIKNIYRKANVHSRQELMEKLLSTSSNNSKQ